MCRYSAHILVQAGSHAQAMMVKAAETCASTRLHKILSTCEEAVWLVQPSAEEWLAMRSLLPVWGCPSCSCWQQTCSTGKVAMKAAHKAYLSGQQQIGYLLSSPHKQGSNSYRWCQRPISSAHHSRVIGKAQLVALVLSIHHPVIVQLKEVRALVPAVQTVKRCGCWYCGADFETCSCRQACTC